MNRLLASISSLVCLTAVLVGFGLSTAPAQAALAVPCTVQVAGSKVPVAAGGTVTVSMSLPGSPEFLAAVAKRPIADVDVNVQFADYYGGIEVKVSNHGDPASGLLLMGAYTPTNRDPNFYVIYDDEAPDALHPESPSGRHRPPAGYPPLSTFDGGEAFPNADRYAWKLSVRNVSSVSQYVGGEATITLATCDIDGDGVDQPGDNCASVVNSGQSDADADGLGNECDPDIDGDSIANDRDNCVITGNLGQADLDGDGVGDLCDSDPDGDGVITQDNCSGVANADQANLDGDGTGDACDLDVDGDGIDNQADKCSRVSGTSRGCPTARRRVRATATANAVVGRVKSSTRSCRGPQRIRLMLVKKGPDKLVAKGRSARSGKFKIRLRGRHGTFYALVKRSYPRGIVQCSKARSGKFGR